MAVPTDSKDIFTRAKEVRTEIDKIKLDIERGRVNLRKAKTELAGLRKQVLDALGRKPRAPRKVKVAPLVAVPPEQCIHGVELSAPCAECMAGHGPSWSDRILKHAGD